MRKSIVLGLFASLAALAPLSAGEVYVPFASNHEQGGTIYRTKIWVTNTGQAARRFSTAFIETGVDGEEHRTASGSLTVAGGGTTLLSNVAPNGKVGMLEVSGAPQLVVVARLEAIGANGDITSSSHIPVVSQANVAEAGSRMHLQGVERTERGTITDFGILNLSREEAQCTVKAFRANNTQISQTVVLTLVPLSQRIFNEALPTLGESRIADARFEVSCDQQFFAYAQVYKVGGPETVFVTPSYALEGDLVAGSSGGGNVPPGSVVFDVPGTFLDAKQGASFAVFDIPADPNVQYRKARIEFDLRTGNQQLGSRNFWGVHSFRRTDRTLYYGLIVRDDRDKTLFDLGDELLVQGQNGGPWHQGTSYYLIFEYDTDLGTCVFTLFQGRTQVEQLTARINDFDIIAGAHKLRVDFGQTKVADGAYFPPVGWKYSNLRVTLER